ncbi:MAG TPA: PQQ-binding-like beta-propeller repeat protein [Candidatus Baltobacteraceae bacterium]|nr:PQQ-binding-like beta-propeller repeat protein [Candidatus Baltobacteraceae bacterium]
MRNRESRKASPTRIALALIALTIGFLGVVCAQRTVVAQGAQMTERAVTVSVVDAPETPRLPLQKLLDTISSVSPDSTPLLDQSDVYAVSAGAQIVRHDVRTKRNDWKASGATPFSHVVASTDRVYVIGPNATVVARNKKSGAFLWTRRVSSSGNLRLSLIRGMLFVEGDDVTRLDPITGAVLWRAQTGRVGKLVAPGLVFASIARGEPIQESISIIDTASGEILNYNPGMPSGIAQIVGIRGTDVLVHVSATSTTIDEDGYALTRIVWLNSATGHFVKNWPYRPDAASHGPDTGIATPIVDGANVAFQSGDSIYVYGLDAAPASQRPLRFDGAGDLIAFRRGQLYTRTDDGLYAIRSEGKRATRRQVLPYHYDPSLNLPALVQTEDTIAVSDGSTIEVLDLVTNKARQYSAACQDLFRVLRSGTLVALQCQNSAATQTGVIYVVRVGG